VTLEGDRADGRPGRRWAPTSETVWVWRIDLDRWVDQSAIARYVTILSADELARADRFLSLRHRSRFVTCRAALRIALADVVGDDPPTLRLRYGPHGKPELESCAVRFSVSHSEHHAAIAVTQGCDVGVDIERDRPIDDRRLLARFIFSEQERDEFERANGNSRAFLNGWTRKEAFIKAHGSGMSLPLHQFSVSLDQPARLLRTDFDRGAVNQWTLDDLPVAEGFAAALALEGSFDRIEYWEIRG